MTLRNRAKQKLEPQPFISVEHADPSLEVVARTAGAAITLVPKGNARVTRYGVAFAPFGGTTNGGASGVGFSRGGVAMAGDGGVAVAQNAGTAECGAHGVAYSSCPRPSGLGRVRGGTGATLVIVWVKNDAGFSRSVRVGEVVDGVSIERGRWYSLDPAQDYRWVAVPVSRQQRK